MELCIEIILSISFGLPNPNGITKEMGILIGHCTEEF
jgi:hypothetical protein